MSFVLNHEGAIIATTHSCYKKEWSGAVRIWRSFSQNDPNLWIFTVKSGNKVIGHSNKRYHNLDDMEPPITQIEQKSITFVWTDNE